MLFPQVYLFFLVVSIQFSYGSILPSAHFIYRLPCNPRLSIFNRVSNLIDLNLDVFCLFFLVYVSSFCAFLSFRALILVGFLLLHRDSVLTSTRFFLTANVSHGSVGLAISLVAMHSAAASVWALMKFLYSSFGEGVSNISWCASNFFPSVNVCLSLVSLLLSRN